jgi:hypothetical protein
MIIAMLSAGRAGHIRSLDWCIPTLLVVRKGESKEYAEAYPRIRQLVVPNSMDSVGKTRQHVIDTLARDHVQVDDDTTYRALDPRVTAGQHLKIIFDHLKRYSLTAFGRQYMGSMRAKEKVEWIDVSGHEVIGLRYEDMRDADLSEFSLYDDTAANIHAMTRRGTLVSYRGVVNNIHTKFGGCAAYRTIEEILADQDRVLRRWPQFVEVVERPFNKTQNMVVDRGLRIRWKEASESRS